MHVDQAAVTALADAPVPQGSLDVDLPALLKQRCSNRRIYTGEAIVPEQLTAIQQTLGQSPGGLSIAWVAPRYFTRMNPRGSRHMVSTIGPSGTRVVQRKRPESE